MKKRLLPPVLLACVLAVYAAWARAGTVAALQGPLPVLGALLLLSLWRPSRGGAPSDRPRFPVLRDPVTWVGAVFLLQLGVQWWNAGRFHYFDPFTASWGYTQPRVPWLPSAMTRAEAAEMLRWFFPAGALILVLRHRVDSTAAARWLLGALAINGGILAVFGIVQQASGTTAIFWVTELPRTRFFASFGYENHAGSYFVLMTALSLGLLIGEIFRPDRRRRPLALVGWGGLSLVNFLGANLAFSRAGILLVWTLAAVALLYVVKRGKGLWKPSTCINVALAGLVVIGVGAMFVDQLAGDTVGKELASLRSTIDPKAAEKPHTTLLLGDRITMLEAAGNIWLDYPWFGCGGWGYRYLMPYELPEDDWKWSSDAYGKANVHNDPAQFLAEFGAVGTGLMVFCVALLAFPALRSFRRSPVTVLALTGAALVVVHSLVDLPFRSPGILYAWIITIGCASVIERRHSAGRDRLDSPPGGRAAERQAQPDVSPSPSVPM